MKKLMFILLLPLLLAGNRLTAQTTAVLWYLPTLSQQQAVALRNYDIFIGDPEIFFANPDAIAWLKKQNPGMKMLCYVNPIEWFVPMFPDKPWSANIVRFLQEIPDWWLTGTDGKILSFWGGTKMMNCFIDCPRFQVNGREMNYIEFFSQAFITGILATHPQIDGVMGDNGWPRVFWLGHHGGNSHGIDRDGDGWADDSASVDRAWSDGLAYFFSEIRKFGGPKFIIISNPGNLAFRESVSGKILENFPDKYVNKKDTVYEAWRENLALTDSLPGPFIFNARVDNYWFTLCSAMLADNAWFSYGQNTAYDERWELKLGQPLDRRCQNGEVWSRLYKNGKVFVNPRAKTAWVRYDDGRYRDQ